MRADEQGTGEKVGGRRRLRWAGIGLGVVSGTAALVLATWFLIASAQINTGDSLSIQPDATDSRGARMPSPPADPLKDFVSSILGDTEDVWREQFRLMKQTYKEPQLVLFTGQSRSACGAATSAIGPSYCPLDEKIFIDLSYFQNKRPVPRGG